MNAPARAAPTGPLTVPLAAAVLSVAAGGIHATVAEEHAREHWAFGAFFVAVAAFQLLWSFAVLTRPSRRVFLAGAAVNLAVVAVWLVSRLVGLPLGPNTWEAEAAGFVDSLVTAYEAGVVVLAIALARTYPAFPRLSAGQTLAAEGATLGAGAAGIVALVMAGDHSGAGLAPTHAAHFALIAGIAVAWFSRRVYRYVRTRAPAAGGREAVRA